MKVLNKCFLLGVVAVLTTATAFSCPQVGGYSARLAVQANLNTCTYVSNRVGAVLTPKACPRFILTDPHYKFAGCQYNRRLNRCVCTITRRM